MRSQRADARRPQASQDIALLTGGTAIGNLTSGGGLAVAFDGTLHVARLSSAYGGPSAGYTSYIGKNWGTPRTVVYAVVSSPTNSGVLNATNSTYHLQGSNDGSSWTTIKSAVFLPPFALTQAPAYGISDLTPYLQHRVLIDGGAGVDLVTVSEVEFYGY